jgi:hypothetical protein
MYLNSLTLTHPMNIEKKTFVLVLAENPLLYKQESEGS